MKRIARISIVFILLGAIANIAVAWLGSIVWPHQSFDRHVKSMQVALTCYPEQWDIFDREDALLWTSLEWNGLHFPDSVAITPKDALQNNDLPSWSVLPTLILDHPNTGPMPYFELGCGFPCVSMSWCSDGLSLKPQLVTSGIQLQSVSLVDQSIGIRRISPRVLPLRIAWLGFAINTLFYAIGLWLLLAAPRAIRSFTRSRRNLCPACAYPVGVSATCTECGKPVRPRVTPSTS